MDYRLPPRRVVIVGRNGLLQTIVIDDEQPGVGDLLGDYFDWRRPYDRTFSLLDPADLLVPERPPTASFEALRRCVVQIGEDPSCAKLDPIEAPRHSRTTTRPRQRIALLQKALRALGQPPG